MPKQTETTPKEKDFTNPNDPDVCEWWNFWENDAPPKLLELFVEYMGSVVKGGGAMTKEAATTIDERQFSYDELDQTYVFLQWKGTDACFDFHCKCGAHYHFDGYFAYVVKCGTCGAYWRMPFNLFPKEIEGPEENDCVVDLTEKDDD